MPSYAMGIANTSFAIQNPGACNADIGAGGNLLDEGVVSAGKCQGAALAPRVIGRPGRQALTFRTDASFRYPDAIVKDAGKNTWTDASGRTLRDRSEIATPWDLPLDADVWVGFDLRIPAGVSDVTGSGAYVMQLWQCTANPIGGLRLQAKPGGSHNIQFVRRGDEPNVDYNTSIGTQTVRAGEWESFVIKYRVVPYRPGGPQGEIEVYHRGAGASAVEEKLLDRAEYFGYSDPTRCANDSYSDTFRIKFGMYKDYQPGATFQADFRNVRIGGSKAEVQPNDRG